MLIVITGASKGIGFELVKKFGLLNDVTIFAVSRNIAPVTKLIRETKLQNIVPVKGDVTKTDARKKLVQLIKSHKQPLHILVNNAGQILNKPFEKINEKELLAVYNTNVFAPFLLTQALVPLFDKKSGHVVNISSMGGFQGSTKFPGLSAYSSSKAAIAGLSECLAEELIPKHISVNCLAIGAVQTEMLSKAFPGYKAPLQPNEMAEFIYDFALNGHRYFNGKIIPVSSTTP